MDCSNARLFLHFARPQAGELDSAEAEALDQHLARCPECAALAHNERRLDQHLGRAVRQVEVPPNLHSQVLARLAQERDGRYRRWLAHGLRGAAAAAILLLLGWGWLTWGPHRKADLDLETLFAQVNVGRPTPGEVEAALKELGVTVQLHEGRLEYAFLSSYSVALLPGGGGKKVAQLDFIQADPHQGRNDGHTSRVRRARVYIISAKEFNLKSLETPPEFPNGYPYKLHVDPPRGGYAYLVFYTGDSVDWLLKET
jgi:hypothetical protein